MREPEIAMTTMDLREFRRSSDADRAKMVAEWLQRFADSTLGEGERDLPPNERI